MNKRKWITGICVIFLTLLYIWSNSLLSMEQSSQQSGKILGSIKIIFNTPPLDTPENQNIIRKTAHFTEFGFLGFEMALLLLVTGTMHWQNMMNILFVGLSTATIDETIQIFALRGSMVSDVILDFGGVLTGIGAGFIFHRLVLLIKKYKRKKKGLKTSGAYISKHEYAGANPTPRPEGADSSSTGENRHYLRHRRHPLE